MTHDDSWWLIMTHDDSSWLMTLHVNGTNLPSYIYFQSWKAGEKRHESPILQLHLSKSWHHGLLFDLLLDSHGNPWKCLRRKGHSLPEGEKSMGASSWASSSCSQRHKTSITSRFEDGKKRDTHMATALHQSEVTLALRRKELFSAAKENLHRPGQTWTPISRAFMWLPTHFQDSQSFNLENVRGTRLSGFWDCVREVVALVHQ